MNTKDIERHVLVIVAAYQDTISDKHVTTEQKKQIEKTMAASGVALFTNFLINMERQATALERIAAAKETGK